MITVLLVAVFAVVISLIAHALVQRMPWACVATGIATIFFFRFLFGYHFPEIGSAGFWITSLLVFIFAAAISFGVGLAANRLKSEK